MSTQKVSAGEVRQRLSRLVDQVQAGDEAVVLRRGLAVGRLVRPEREEALFPT
jgi:antitoxin (DNA-binding transcriptional repressor) of toxin-antitoxin stability system